MGYIAAWLTAGMLPLGGLEMPDKRFRVNIYDVGFSEGASSGTPFSTAVDNAIAQPPDIMRYQVANGKGRRLEHDEYRDGVYLLNFVSFEYAGPGRSTPATPAEHIALSTAESFTHDTAVLYDPNADLAFVESTQGGMGPGAIASYFEAFADERTEYLLLPRLDDEAAARARRHQTIRNLSIRIGMGPVTDADRAAGTGTLKAFGEGFGAGQIDISIKSLREKNHSLTLGRVWEVANEILGSVGDHTVTQLKVTGREHDDEGYEIIDLLQHREKRDRMLTVDATTRKVEHTVRWDALINVRQEFISNVGQS